ncbi:GspE/PulE family protein [Microaerobacter geothermalis]|uniref:GspE/PulE family protein n=1 Tax=Microaerobacter geothermalis TaxID=674972 RepID=UPI001F327F5A|nr:GspE/PulE family protein [Microaerobacter geothermalis]MCF6094211.1 GspE/PulE family protein [Microaerobacter geothermalis]
MDKTPNIDHILKDAVEKRASDVHIEPSDEKIMIRIRIDGMLFPYETYSRNAHSALISKLKVLGGMDIGERRRPQDGGFSRNIGDIHLDIRISTIPTIQGEKMVLRLLRKDSYYKEIQQLGLEKEECEQFLHLLSQPYGMILVTGPTGSGKTTTLYAALQHLRNRQVNITTLEDPVEYRMDGVNQIQVNPKAGVTFSAGLRSILRQDPDIIMLGEIRDKETADIALRAALTGHLVLATLHTKDCVTAIFRLIDMGIEPFLVSSALTGIVAQRLIRRSCLHCVQYEKKMELCPVCHGTGYHGRKAVFELLPIDEDLERLINQSSSIKSIRDYSEKKGVITLKKRVMDLVDKEITTYSEYKRVVFTHVE